VRVTAFTRRRHTTAATVGSPDTPAMQSATHCECKNVTNLSVVFQPHSQGALPSPNSWCPRHWPCPRATLPPSPHSSCGLV
jgi:hypothetical protein